MNSKLWMGDIDHWSRDNVRGSAGMFGAVRETADYRGKHRTAVGGNDGHFCCYTQTENFKNFE